MMKFVLVLCVAVLLVALVAPSSADIVSDIESGVSNTERRMENTFRRAENDALGMGQSVSNRLQRMLRSTTDTLRDYGRRGYNNLPSFSGIMRTPDKLLRAEVAMLRDEIQMGRRMMQGPVSAVTNLPQDLRNMASHMAREIQN